ncbi:MULTISPECIES: low molecular weight protein-tyrosine-phosphatase [Arthrobacter]|uniref:protein-tyrosine-phosphatase n=2 Tax=Arthrobacter TaxID=1663 RepID=A0ABU9KNS5_9MICC|nr:low molecular weight protein-tyrosine-phosphatase [Arthrobacter sp. YJM1]MDP5228448.1 low molecular weight protein-tyrosine-phosphatase [Arthrobacter sp. YJM1]
MAETPFRVVTVCTGNICRSPMAEYLLRHALQEDTRRHPEEWGHAGEGHAGEGAAESVRRTVVVDSAGISDEEAGRPMDSRAASQLRELGVDPAGHVARAWDNAWFQGRDLILAMDVNHYRALIRWAPDERSRAKVRMFRSFDPALAGKDPEEQGIYDPWYGDRADFVECGDMISSTLEPLVAFIRASVAHEAQPE